MKKQIHIIFLLALFVQVKSQVSDRYTEMKTHFDNSEVVFEGYFIKSNPSFLTSKKEVFTLNDFKVVKLIKGKMSSDSIIKIEVEGGSYIDTETGMGVESRNSHGNGFIPSLKAIYYLYPSNERGNNKLKRMIDISNPNKIVYNDIEVFNSQLYIKLSELYADMSIISGQKLEVEKKNLEKENVEKNKLHSELTPAEKSTNFDNLYTSKLKVANTNLNAKNSLVNDLTLQIINPVVSGSTFEFDINIKADNNTTYLDNIPVKIAYNNSVFNPNLVAAGNVTITNGTPFNNINYYTSNSFMQDINANSFQFLLSAIVTNPVRTQITTTYKQLAHVKLGIVNCGLTAVSLTDAAIAVNGCWYYTTATASTGLQFYNSLTYNGGVLNSNVTFCPPVIKDFTSPVNGGLNQTLTIKGSKFGAVRGNGQVKFRNADAFGFPFMKRLDDLDYISWNDTMIKVKMPSTIDTLNFGTGANLSWTPGSGKFKVITNTNDSAVSGLNLASKTFSVYYSIFNSRPLTAGISKNQKLKANLIKSITSTGGYVIRLDTSVGNDPLKKTCIKKAIKDWACLTAVNIKMGVDTAMQLYGVSDYKCNIFMADQSIMSTPNTIAETVIKSVNCASTPNVKAITDFDIRINKAYLPKFIYDTLILDLPAFKIDFLETMYHEIAHGIGMMHVTDSSAVMYYRTLGNLSYSISANSRRRPVPFTSDVDGMDNQVVTSNQIITNQCGLQDMVLLNSGSCAIIGVKELYNNNFNLIVYPNPTKDGVVYLTFDSFDKIKPLVEIRDILGKLVYSEPLSNEYNNHYNHKLNLNNFENGIYILIINSNNLKSTYKLIKQ